MTKPLTGDPKYYLHITLIIITSLCLNGSMIFILNINTVNIWLVSLIGEKKAFIMQLYFWAAARSTIACSIFMKNDKDINELESLKDKPDSRILRYPNIYDVYLYLERILTSGFLGIFGAVLLLAGLGYFDVNPETLTVKHKLFLIIFSFLIGLYQANFLTVLNEMSRRFFTNTKKQ